VATTPPCHEQTGRDSSKGGQIQAESSERSPTFPSYTLIFVTSSASKDASSLAPGVDHQGTPPAIPLALSLSHTPAPPPPLSLVIRSLCVSVCVCVCERERERERERRAHTHTHTHSLSLSSDEHPRSLTAPRSRHALYLMSLSGQSLSSSLANPEPCRQTIYLLGILLQHQGPFKRRVPTRLSQWGSVAGGFSGA
jgi:hypothetical protein